MSYELLRRWLLLTALIIFLTVYTVLIWDKFNRAVIALLGASLVILLGVLNQEKAVEGIDFNTLGLLIGMMIIVTVCQKTGVFQYIAIKSMDFVVNLAPAVLVVMIATFIPVYFMYGHKLKVDSNVREKIMQFNEREALQDTPLLKKCLFVLA